MPFKSKYDNLIWERLYTARIPNIPTMDTDYIKTRGIHVTNDRNIDKMIKTDKVTVMIPIAKILEYYTEGIEIEILSREDLLSIHKSIELYLDEWKQHLTYDINLDKNQYKELLVSLEKLSKDIYERAKPSEVLSSYTFKSNFGMVNSLQKLNKEQNIDKPDYQGISEYFKNKRTRF